MNNNTSKAISSDNFFYADTPAKKMDTISMYDVVKNIFIPDFQYDITQGQQTSFQGNLKSFSGLVENILMQFDFEENSVKRIYINCIPRSNGEIVVTLTGINCSIQRLHDFGHDPEFFKVLADHHAMIEISDMVRAACLIGTVFIRMKQAS